MLEEMSNTCLTWTCVNMPASAGAECRWLNLIARMQYQPVWQVHADIAETQQAREPERRHLLVLSVCLGGQQVGFAVKRCGKEQEAFSRWCKGWFPDTAFAQNDLLQQLGFTIRRKEIPTNRAKTAATNMWAAGACPTSWLKARREIRTAPFDLPVQAQHKSPPTP